MNITVEIEFEDELTVEPEKAADEMRRIAALIDEGFLEGQVAYDGSAVAGWWRLDI